MFRSIHSNPMSLVQTIRLSLTAPTFQTILTSPRFRQHQEHQGCQDYPDFLAGLRFQTIRSSQRFLTALMSQTIRSSPKYLAPTIH